jgi:hypothetical protein
MFLLLIDKVINKKTDFRFNDRKKVFKDNTPFNSMLKQLNV